MQQMFDSGPKVLPSIGMDSTLPTFVLKVPVKEKHAHSFLLKKRRAVFLNM